MPAKKHGADRAKYGDKLLDRLAERLTENHMPSCDRRRPLTLSTEDVRYPRRLQERLGAGAPAQLSAMGNLDLLTLPMTALFCSARCPGSAILPTHDRAARWRDAGRCVVSGFHSPVERECLQILLRGSQPIVICPARALPQRVPSEWRWPLANGRLLLLSGFKPAERRVTAQLASRRNELVAALADEVWFAHITPGGQSERLFRRICEWGVPFSTLQSIDD